MRLDRRHLLITALSLPFTLPATAQGASLLDRVRKAGVIRIGTTGDYFPYSFRDLKTGGFQGYEIDVATRLAADLGVKLQLVQATWPTLVAGLMARKYDIAATGVTVTPERAKAVAFSKAYLHPTFIPLILKKDAERFKSWDDLDQPGVTIAVQQGTAPETMAKKVFTKARILSVADPVIDFTEVLAGRAQAAFTDNLYFLTKIGREYPQLTMLTNGTRPGTETDNAIMSMPGDADWLLWLNKWIDARLADGFFDGLFKTWFEGTGPAR
ncbi:transporter substrate-binding domain-containing protein [Niveispirillum sp. KHB5.9]|uniref:transporter substrate-binding domain-containing protein n=1 Tax=Niveispirillum sp. KHB5.9 TaxID=3400269 RepID=UPI003A87A80E